MNNYYIGIHYENKIDDVLIKYISSFEEAKEYIQKNRGNKILMFYQSNGITPEEHLEIQKMQWNIQLYSIINNFMPSNLDNISSYLYNIYSCVFATSALSTLNELNNDHIKLIHIVLDNLSNYLNDDHFISHSIMIRCNDTLRNILKEHYNKFNNKCDKYLQY